MRTELEKDGNLDIGIYHRHMARLSVVSLHSLLATMSIYLSLFTIILGSAGNETGIIVIGIFAFLSSYFYMAVSIKLYTSLEVLFKGQKAIKSNQDLELANWYLETQYKFLIKVSAVHTAMIVVSVCTTIYGVVLIGLYGSIELINLIYLLLLIVFFSLPKVHITMCTNNFTNSLIEKLIIVFR